MTQHTELTDDQTKAARWLDEVRQYLTAAADSSMSRNNSEQLAYELLEALPANALEAQAREIAELKAQESELCTLHGLAEAECKRLRTELDYSQMAAGAEARRVDELTAECKKLRAELDRANKVAALIHEGLKTIPQDEPTPHGAQP